MKKVDAEDATVPVVRPPGVRRSTYPGWEDTPSDADRANTLEERLEHMAANARSGDPVRAALALEEIRAVVRRELAQPAEALGIKADDPLLIERVAFELAQRAELWNAPTRKVGRKPMPDAKAEARYRKLEDFLVRYREKKPGATDRAALKGTQFGKEFPDIAAKTARNILTEGRGGKWDRKQVPSGISGSD